MHEVVKRSQQPKYSLFIPFTRVWFVERFFSQLTMLKIPRQEFEVVFYNDSSNRELHDKLLSWLQQNQDFNGLSLYTSNNHPLGENDIMERRRNRIVQMKQKSIELIGDSEFVWGLEDDTTLPLNSFSRLLSLIESNPNVGVVSGIQQGRHASPIIGAWKIKPLNNPTYVSTVKFKESGIQEVDGVGWYNYITFTRLYKEANYHYEAEFLGPDVCYAWDLRKQGYKVLVDWSIVCPHVTQYGTFIPTSDNTSVLTWHNTNGSWIKSRNLRIKLDEKSNTIT